MRADRIVRVPDRLVAPSQQIALAPTEGCDGAASRPGNEDKQIRRAKVILIALLVAAFGPYLVPSIGLRTDHIIIYGMAAVLFVRTLLSTRPIRVVPPSLAIVAILCCVLLWTLLATASGAAIAGRSTIQIIADAENYTQPIAIVAVVMMATAGMTIAARQRLLASVAMVTCVLAVANAGVALATIKIDTWPLVQHFVGIRGNAQTDAGTVWQRAAQLGRYTGLFDQPLEAGLAYSIAGLSWIYAVAVMRKTTVLRWVLLVGVIVGGVLTVSKIFVIGGVVTMIMYALLSRARRIIIGWRALVAGGLATGIGAFVVGQWQGINRLLRLFDTGDVDAGGLLAKYTARRFGDEAFTVVTLFRRTYEESPIYGFGFGARGGLPIDNGYLEFFFQGGAVALGLYCIILLIMLAAAIRGLRGGSEEGKLLAALWILTTGAAFGGPVFTANRSSVIFWIVVTLGISIAWRRAGDRGSRAVAMVAGVESRSMKARLASGY